MGFDTYGAYYMKGSFWLKRNNTEGVFNQNTI